MLMFTSEGLKNMLARTIGMLFLQGTTKCVGVIFDDTIKYLKTDVFLVEWSFTIIRATSLLSAPVTGTMMNFLSHRIIGSIGGLLAGLGLLCEAFIATNVWLLFLSNVLTGLGFGLELTTALIGLAENISGDNMYGATVVSASLIGTIGMAFLPLLVEFWREKYGFVWAVALYGALTFNLIPTSLLLSSHFDEDDKSLEVVNTNEITDSRPFNSVKDNNKGAPKHSHVISSHRGLIPLLIAKLSGYVIMTIWAMFLVPSASQKGHPQSIGVFLSTVGGVGVFTGRAITVALFYFELMGFVAVLGTTLVLSCTLFVHVYTYDFLLLCIITFFSAVCLGLATSWSNAFVKMVTCKKHFKTATIWGNTTAGLGTVTLGIVPGLLYHIRESYDDMFVFLAFVAMAMAMFSGLALFFKRSNPDCEDMKRDAK